MRTEEVYSLRLYFRHEYIRGTDTANWHSCLPLRLPTDTVRYIAEIQQAFQVLSIDAVMVR